MGCAQSAQLAGTRAPLRAPAPPEEEEEQDAAKRGRARAAEAYGTGASVREETLQAAGAAGAAVGAAAGVAAAIGAPGVVKEAGEALMELAKTIPFVAPLAFLVGAVASSAATAVSLREDCAEFARIVSTLEMVLVRAQSLENQADVVDDVRESLEEALQMMAAMQDRGMLMSTFLAKADKNRFEELKKKIEGALNRLTLSASVDTAAIANAKFRQSEELCKDIEQYGGPEAVVGNPNAMEAIAGKLEAADKLVLASVSKVQNSVDDTHKNVKLMRKESKKMSDSVDMQTQKLDQMTDSFLAARQEAEIARLKQEVLSQQVNELKSMLSEVKNAMTLFPMPAREPERMHVINDGNFMFMTENDAAHPAIDTIVREATRQFGASTLFNVIGGRHQYTAAGYLVAPPNDDEIPVIPEHVSDPARAPPPDRAIKINGMKVSRKASSCQHVVAKQDEVEYEGQVEYMAKIEDLMAASKVDPVLQETLMAIGNLTAPGGGSTGDPEKDTIAMKILTKTIGSEKVFYAGVPVKVEGETVGSFCVYSPERPPGFGEEQLEKMREYGKKVEAALTAQVTTNRQKEAQKAMLAHMQQQQMMMMQQMRMAGMDPNHPMFNPNMAFMGTVPNPMASFQAAPAMAPFQAAPPAMAPYGMPGYHAQRMPLGTIGEVATGIPTGIAKGPGAPSGMTPRDTVDVELELDGIAPAAAPSPARAVASSSSVADEALMHAIEAEYAPAPPSRAVPA